MITHLKQHPFFYTAIIALISLGFLFSYSRVYANPAFFIQVKPSYATSSPIFMSPGTATTTYTFDAQTGITQGVDSAVLLGQFTGSSTVSQLKAQIEYSQDGIDWYQDFLYGRATSTQVINIPGPISYIWTFASSSPGGLATTTSTSTIALQVPTPTRYVRAVFSVPLGAGNGAIWAQWVGKRQTSN